MKRFWLSWEETSEDCRPLNDPPRAEVIAWWCSGSCERHWTMVALVEAVDEVAAQAAILTDWPGEHVWRFCEERGFDFRPNDRFPLTKGWQRERIEKGSIP